MQLQPAGAADPVEADGDEDVDDFVGDEQAAEDGNRHGGDDFVAHAGGEEHGGQGDDGHAFGEEFGAEAVDCAFQDGLAEFVEGGDFFQAAAVLDGFAEVDEHDDAGLGGHAEAGDESDPNGHAEILLSQAQKIEFCQPEEEYSADEGLGHGHHHEHGVHEVVVGEVKDDEDQ